MIGRRKAATAALAILMAGAVVAVALGRTPRWGATFESSDLPWESVLLDGAALTRAQIPTAILYVLPSCTHCDSATRMFVAETRRSAVNALVISASGTAEAESYRRKLNLVRIATDSAQRFGRAAGIRVVPTLGRTGGDGRITVAPIPRPQLVAAYLRMAP